MVQSLALYLSPILKQNETTQNKINLLILLYFLIRQWYHHVPECHPLLLQVCLDAVLAASFYLAQSLSGSFSLFPRF